MSIQNLSSINILYSQWEGGTQHIRIYKTVRITADCYYRDALEGDECVELKWEDHEYSKMPIGCYINIDGRNFYATEPHEPTRRAEDVFTFNPIFYAEPYHWKKAQACCYGYTSDPVVDIDGNTIDVSVTYGSVKSRELDWSFKGNLTDALSMLLQSIFNETNAHWTAAWVSEVSDKLIEIQAQGLSVFDMLTQIAEKCGKEFYFDYSGERPAIHIGTLEIETTGEHTETGADNKSRVVLRVGTDITNPQVSSNAEDYYTRFYFFGSNRNIVQPNSITKSSVVNRRLPLNPAPISGSSMHSYPDGFIDIDVNAGSYDGNGKYIPSNGKAYSKSVFFDDIYPHSNLKICYVEKIYIKVTDNTGAETGELMPIFYVRIGTWNGSTYVPVDYDDTLWDETRQTGGNRLPNLEPSIAFRSGYLQGLEYELAYHHGSVKTETIKGFDANGNPTTLTINYDCFEIQTDNNSNPRLPNDTICPRGKDNSYDGDDCTLFNIKMPDSYIVTAQDELETKALEYIADLKVDKNTYTVDSNPKNFDGIAAFKPDALKVGTLVKMVYPNNESVLSRVVSVERHLDINADCKITLGYKASQGTIQTLREVVADTSSNVETVVRAADKSKSQINGLRNGYRAQKETLDSVFDTDGYFDTDNIRPLSIDTSMLSVGVKSQQFTLSGITFSIAPFTSGNGTVAWTGGKLSHFTIDENTVKEWIFSAGTNNLTSSPAAGTDTGVWYIYARCNKTSTSGDFYFSQEQKLFDSDSTYWYFLVGIVSSRMTNPENQSYYIRYINMTYGTTTVTGRQITTGVIKSADGNGVIIDLDNNTIIGNIKFLSGGQAVDAEQYINNTVDAEVGALGVANRNFLRYSELIDKSKPTFSTTTAQPNGSYVFNDVVSYGTNQSTYILVTFPALEIGQKYTFSFKYNRQLSAQTLVLNIGGTTKTVTTANDTAWRTMEMTFTASSSTTNAAIYINQASDSWVVAYKEFKLEKGEAATEWELAPEDINEVANMQIGGRNFVLGTATPLAAGGVEKHYSMSPKFATVVNETYSISFDITLTSSMTFTGSDLIMISESIGGTTRYWGILTSGTYTAGTHHITKKSKAPYAYTSDALFSRYLNNSAYRDLLTVSNVKVEKGTVATDWTPAPEDSDYLKIALAEATSGTTEIEGGLINTKMIQAGSGSSQAGMVGLESLMTAFFAGGSVADAESMVAPVVIKRDGFTKLGVLLLDPSGIITMTDTTTSRTPHLMIKNGNVPEPQAQDIEYNNSNNTPTNIIYSSFSASGTNSQANTRQQVWSAPLKSSISSKHNGMNVLVKSGTATYTVTGGMGVQVYVYVIFRVTGIERTVAQFNVGLGSSGSASGTINIMSQSLTFNASGSTGAIDALMYVESSASGCQVSVGSIQYGWYHDCTSLQTTLADNGLAVIKDNLNFFRAIAGSGGMTTTIKGNTDIPGVLWAGRVAQGGTPTKAWGNVNVSLSYNTKSTGIYTLNLSGAKSGSSVIAIANVVGSSTNGWTAKIETNSPSTIKVRIYNDNQLADSYFNLVIFGTT